MMHTAKRLINTCLLLCFVQGITACKPTTEGGRENAACYFWCEDSLVACDFDIRFARSSNSSFTTYLVSGPIVLGVAKPGEDAAWGGVVNDALDGHATGYEGMAFEPGGVYLFTSRNQARRIGSLPEPIQIRIEGKWPAQGCGWMITQSLFADDKSSLNAALTAALKEWKTTSQ